MDIVVINHRTNTVHSNMHETAGKADKLLTTLKEDMNHYNVDILSYRILMPSQRIIIGGGNYDAYIFNDTYIVNLF